VFFSKKNRFTLEDENDIEQMIDAIESFVDDKINDIDLDINPKIKFRNIQNRLLTLSEKIIIKSREDLSVQGEIMLLLEKVSDGFMDDRIYNISSNPKLSYTAKSINIMVANLEKNLNSMIEVLDIYQNGDYTRIKYEKFILLCYYL